MKTSKAFPALKKLAGGVAVADVFGAAGPAHALTIKLTSTGNANADAGFQAAANFWQSVVIALITVERTPVFAPVGPGSPGRRGPWWTERLGLRPGRRRAFQVSPG